MTDEWGPWIEHDGSGCPCVGYYIQIELDRDAKRHPDRFIAINSRTFEGLLSIDLSLGAEWSWDWGARVMRYRIRRPKALLQLIEMVETLPEHKGVDA